MVVPWVVGRPSSLALPSMLSLWGRLLLVSGRSAMVVPWLLRGSSAPALSLLTVLLLLPARVLAVPAVALLLPPCGRTSPPGDSTQSRMAVP